MKHLKRFKTEVGYTQFKDTENFVLPNVSYVEETKDVKFNPNVELGNPNVVCTYNVTDISLNTSLLYAYALKYITGMIVDGVEMDVETYYQFDTEGLHTIEYILDDNTTLPDMFFQNTENLISIEIPDTVSSVICNFVSYGLDNLKEIIFHSPICPTITGDDDLFSWVSNESCVIKYPKGADYSEIITNLPEGWTAVEF